MSTFVVFGLLCAVCFSQFTPSKQWEDEFDHYTYLSSAETFRLYWNVLGETEQVEIGLEVETNDDSGWIGFGISDNGQMIFADIIMGWIDDDSTEYLQRRHTESDRIMPIFDEDITDDLIEAERNGTVIRMRFTRELFPCATKQEPYRKQIVMGTTQIIWAFGPSNPIINDNNPNGLAAQHDLANMGRQTINFFSGESPKIEMPDDVESFDFLMDNYNVPAEDTMYHCKFIELPQELDTVNHLIRLEPLIEESSVHHIVLYWCQGFNTSYIGFETDCNGFANMDFDGAECRSEAIQIGAWAVGAGDYYFPEHAGFPIAGKMYVLLEIHYDNPDLRSDIIDSSGMRIYYTPTLREYNISRFTTGAFYSATFHIGDTDQSITQSFHSVAQCTQSSDIDTFDAVYAFSGNLHSHTIGVGMKLRHIRNNIELPPIMQNDNYDFNYQMWISLKEEVQILPGDEFICECTYNNNADPYTSNEHRVYPTYGGQSTRDEMCVCTLHIYPAINMSGGFSTFIDSDFSDFFGKAIDEGWFNGTTSWLENEQNKDLYYYDGTNDDAVQHFIDFQGTEERFAICRSYYGDASDLWSGMYTVPPARKDFEALSPDDFGDCDEDDQGEDELTTEEIVIISVASGIVLFIVVGVLVYFYKRKNKNSSGRPYEPMMVDENTNEKTQYGAVAK